MVASAAIAATDKREMLSEDLNAQDASDWSDGCGCFTMNLTEAGADCLALSAGLAEFFEGDLANTFAAAVDDSRDLAVGPGRTGFRVGGVEELKDPGPCWGVAAFGDDLVHT